MSRLTPEERDAVIDQMLERIREDLEWVLTLETAKTAAAAAPLIAVRGEGPRVGPPPIPARKYHWPSALARTRAR